MKMIQIPGIARMYLLVAGCVLLAACGAPDIVRLEENRDVNRLVKALENKDIKVAIAAAGALGRIGDPAAVEPLIESTWGNQDLRLASVIALGGIGDPSAIDHLIYFELNDPENLPVREAAATALAQIGTPAIEELLTIIQWGDQVRNINDELDLQITGSISALIQMGEPATGALIVALEEGGDFSRQKIAEVLEGIGWQPTMDEAGCTFWMARQDGEKCTGIGTPVVELLLRFLASENVVDRINAARALGEIGDHRAVAPLTTALEDPDLGVRFVAAVALSRFETTSVMEPLLAGLRVPDENISIADRLESIQALGRIGDERAIDTLVAALYWPWDDIFEPALDAMIQIDRERAVESLITNLQTANEYDTEPRMRMMEALGRIGDYSAIEPLVAMLQVNNWKVREAALATLNQISQPKLTELDPILSALAPVCLGGVLSTSIQDVLPSQFFPLVVLDVYGRVNAWTPVFLWEWEADVSPDVLLVACLDEQVSVIETCTYGGAGAITRHDQRIEIIVRKADTGLEVGYTTIQHSANGCPVFRTAGDSAWDTYGDEIFTELETWLSGFVP